MNVKDPQCEHIPLRGETRARIPVSLWAEQPLTRREGPGDETWPSRRKRTLRSPPPLPREGAEGAQTPTARRAHSGSASPALQRFG